MKATKTKAAYKTKRPRLVRVTGTFVEAALPRSLLKENVPVHAIDGNGTFRLYEDPIVTAP
jgi:hypothetical protein